MHVVSLPLIHYFVGNAIPHQRAVLDAGTALEVRQDEVGEAERAAPTGDQFDGSEKIQILPGEMLVRSPLLRS